MGKLFMYAIVAIMITSAGAWIAGLCKSSAGAVKWRTYAPIIFATTGIFYTVMVLVIGDDFALSGFVHHEGFVAVAMMIFAPVVGIMGAAAALVVNFLVVRLAKKPH